MSLFDVIRYPISYPLTIYAYLAVPKAVRDRWATAVLTSGQPITCDNEDQVNLLRRMIEDYEPI